MQPAGLKAYETRKENKMGIYSYEQRSVNLEEPYNDLLKKNGSAWSFFQAQPASYRKVISWWIISAKKEETRLKRSKNSWRIRRKGSGYQSSRRENMAIKSPRDVEEEPQT
jgi:uncharacterized protein YdeI (YjbR/CyaY-like superfamily)